jgi:hypothetical protein
MYEIGQVIYVLSNKTQNILPGVVLEKIYYTRLDGESVSYKLAIGPAGRQKILDISRVNGEIFGSLDDIHARMMDQVSAWVDGVCKKAGEQALEWYGERSNLKTTLSNNPADKVDPDDIMNEIAQQPANITRQQNTSNNYQQFQTPQANLTVRMAENGLLERDVVMEDGTVRKVSINTNPK